MQTRHACMTCMHDMTARHNIHDIAYAHGIRTHFGHSLEAASGDRRCRRRARADPGVCAAALPQRLCPPAVARLASPADSHSRPRPLATMSSDDLRGTVICFDSANIRQHKNEIYSIHAKRRLKDSKLINERLQHRCVYMHVVGLARVIPGSLRDGPCTDWNVEEQLCWSLIDFADDAASGQVLDYAQSSIPSKQRLTCYRCLHQHRST